MTFLFVVLACSSSPTVTVGSAAHPDAPTPGPPHRRPRSANNRSGGWRAARLTLERLGRRLRLLCIYLRPEI